MTKSVCLAEPSENSPLETSPKLFATQVQGPKKWYTSGYFDSKFNATVATSFQSVIAANRATSAGPRKCSALRTEKCFEFPQVLQPLE